MHTVSATARQIRELFDLPGVVRSLARWHELIRTMAWRSFSARYRNSFGGLFWSVFQPLLMMAIYTVVFSLFLKVKFGKDPSPFAFAAYLLCGLLPWQAFSEGLGASTGLIRGHANLVKRTVFPLEVLPVNLSLAAALQQLIGFGLLVPLVWAVKGRLPWTILLVPVILALQLLFAMGMNWIVSSLAVFVPDLGQMVALLTTAWMFMTPIFYPQEAAPPWGQVIFRLNPMARLVNLYRDAFMNGLWPDLPAFAVTAGVCLFVFLVGYSLFMQLKRGFIDVL